MDDHGMTNSLLWKLLKCYLVLVSLKKNTYSACVSFNINPLMIVTRQVNKVRAYFSDCL